VNRYAIQHKIRTLAELYPDGAFSSEGFQFSQWDFSWSHGPAGQAWHASKTIDAQDADTAIRSFRSALSRVADRIAFVSQCFTTIEDQPFLILKEDNNPSMTFFFYHSSESGAVPLAFDDDERAALEALSSYEEKGNVFRLLREATNAPWFYPRFTMLVAALEAMAGEVLTADGKGKITNREYIKDVILRDENLTNKIFRYRDGLRNQILHGRPIDEKAHAGVDYIGKIYGAILRYFHDLHGVKINTSVVHPMRTPTENFMTWRGWLAPKRQDIEINLREIWKMSKSQFEHKEQHGEQHFDEIFDILTDNPENY